MVKRTIAEAVVVVVVVAGIMKTTIVRTMIIKTSVEIIMIMIIVAVIVVVTIIVAVVVEMNQDRNASSDKINTSDSVWRKVSQSVSRLPWAPSLSLAGPELTRPKASSIILLQH